AGGGRRDPAGGYHCRGRAERAVRGRRMRAVPHAERSEASFITPARGCPWATDCRWNERSFASLRIEWHRTFFITPARACPWATDCRWNERSFASLRIECRT